MSREDIEVAVRACIVRAAALPPDTDFSTDAPLGDIGGGLDSLALSEFIAEVESVFDVALPDDWWLDTAHLRISAVVDELSTREVTHREEGLPRVEPSTLIDKSKESIRRRGVLGGVLDVADRGVRRILRPVVTWHDQWIVGLALDADGPAAPPPPEGLAIRPLTVGSPGIQEWLPAEDAMVERVQRREERGYRAHGAWLGDELVAVHWMVQSPYSDPVTGLEIRPRPRHCFSLDVRERDGYEGRGFGLALLRFSLVWARENGIEEVVALIPTENTRSILASVHLMGFQTEGRVRTIDFRGRARGRWRRGDRRGRDVLEV